MGIKCEYNGTLQKKTVSILDAHNHKMPHSGTPGAMLMIEHIAEVSEL